METKKPENKTNLHLKIDPELKQRLQIQIVKRNKKLSEALAPLIKAYVEKMESEDK